VSIVATKMNQYSSTFGLKAENTMIFKTLHGWHCHVVLLVQTEQKHSVRNVWLTEYQTTFVIKVHVIYTARASSICLSSYLSLLHYYYNDKLLALTDQFRNFDNTIKVNRYAHADLGNSFEIWSYKG
jgi:hypothetical protein